MYTLISKFGNVQRVTTKESKRDELLRLGYRLVQESEKGSDPKRKKRTSQSTAETPKADKE